MSAFIRVGIALTLLEISQKQSAMKYAETDSWWVMRTVMTDLTILKAVNLDVNQVL